jgi:hypothetical protein
MSNAMSTDPWPCPHCLQPLTYSPPADGQPIVAEGDDLLLDLPAGWMCTNEACPTRQAGYHPDEGAKQRVLMLYQAAKGSSSPGTAHGG